MRTPLLLAGLLTAAISTSTGVSGQPRSSPQAPPPPVAVASDATSAQVERGRYLVALGDCVACHTQSGGARFAGGRPLQTPFGTVLSANLTPDRDTGIGRWTADQFYRALREGIDDKGRHLYPAFPYNYYTRVTRADADAIFAYLRSLPPVRHDFERNRLPFPFNIRSLMVVWNWLYLDEGTLPARPAQSAEWNRGAYLVEGLGHCQACHTPKNLLGAPKRDEAFHGGSFGNWFAPDITTNRRTGLGGWTDAELRDFLQRGINAHSAASGEMGEVVAFSSSQMSDADLQAVMTYLRSLPASPPVQMAKPVAAVMKQGEALWQDNCAACHRIDGSGSPGYFPPLKGNPNLQQSDPTTVLHFILAGTRKVPTDAAPTPLSMPAFHWKLDDDQIAAVATYARNSWGNAAPPVSAEQVGHIRGELSLALRQQHDQPAGGMARPGVNTLAPAGSDSRDNGSPQAGKVVAEHAVLPVSGGGNGVPGGTLAPPAAASRPAAAGQRNPQRADMPAGHRANGPG